MDRPIDHATPLLRCLGRIAAHGTVFLLLIALAAGMSSAGAILGNWLGDAEITVAARIMGATLMLASGAVYLAGVAGIAMRYGRTAVGISR